MVDFDESDDEDFGIKAPRPQQIELAALTRGPEHSVRQANFRRLDGQVWLDDTIIDMFLHTYVNEYCDGVRCTRTHFMTKLLEGVEGDSDIDAVESAMENYCEVQDWDHGSAGGLAALDYLFVPINVENWHWIFLSVDLKGRKICLYNSMGSADPRNRKYLAAMRRYLYDADFENDEDRADFDDWKLGWSLQDRSRHAPKQQNGTDCGVFTLLSIYLASRGVALRRSTYTQEAVYDCRMRRSIALALMKANDTPPENSVANYFTRIPAPRRGACASRSARGRKRRRVESRVAVGSSRIRDPAPPQSETSPGKETLNKKRSAKSLANSRKRKITIAQMLRQPPKRARKEDLVGERIS